MIDIIELATHRPQGPTWSEVRSGDGVSYPDGAIFYFVERAMDDGTQVTFVMRCIVPPNVGDYSYGDTVLLSVENNMLLPEGVTCTRGYRDIR